MTYSEEQKKDILESICDRLVEGESLRKISMDKNMPSKSTLFKWMEEDEYFRTTIARARDLQAEALFDDMTHLINRMLEEDIDANKIKTAIWAKQWQAGKLKPKKYGDSSMVKLADNEGNKLQGIDVGFISGKSTNTDT